MRESKAKLISEDAIWMSKLEFERLNKMTFETFEKMDYGSCSLKFSSGGGRDICRLIWRIIHYRNKK